MAGANDWAASARYPLADGTKRVKKFTYAMTRATLLDGPGAHAIWNITNVTRSDRHYLYITAAWAKAMSEDDEVVNAIKNEGKNATSLLHPYYGDGSEDSIRHLVSTLLALNTKAGSDTYKKYFVDMSPWNGQEEMGDEDYYAFAVWHKGLAVPQARNLDNEDVQRGKELFYKMGCTAGDIQQAVVYLRDAADYGRVERFLAECYPRMPHVVVHAPVCRPGWLIETECVAIREESASL